MKAVARALFAVARCYALALLVVALCWSLVELAPGSTVERAAIASGALVPGDVATPTEERREIARALGENLGIHPSAPQNVLQNVWRAARMDFGRSWRDASEVRGIVVSAAGRSTLLLSLAALLLAIAAAVGFAPRGAQFAATPEGHFGTALAAAVLCTPIPWLAMLSQETLAYGHPLAIAPSGGLDGLGHAIVPILVLAAVPAAVFYSHLRSALQQATEAPWVLALRARGIPERRLWRVHALRLALPTVVALIPAMLAYLLAASVVVERVFAIPGLGAALGRAAASGDAPVMVAIAALSAAAVHGSSRASDAIARRLDPRRVESEARR